MKKVFWRNILKIFELKKNDRFIANLYDPENDELALTISGVFKGMDGHYAKVMLYGCSELQYLHCSTIVELE